MPTDFRVKVGYQHHPKIKKLRKRLGAEGVLCHLAMIEYATINKPSGILDGMTIEDIEAAADFMGDEGSFVQTLTEYRLLDIDNGTYSIHDWTFHNPWVAGAPTRSEHAKKAIEARWEGERIRREYSENTAGIPNDTHGILSVIPPSSPILPPPNPTMPIPSVPEDICSGEAATKKIDEKPLRLRIPPDLEWCKEYALNMNYPHGLAEAFYDHFLGNGWKVGMAKTLMVDWQACMRTFKRNDTKFNGLPARNGSKGETLQEQSDAMFQSLYGDQN